MNSFLAGGYNASHDSREICLVMAREKGAIYTRVKFVRRLPIAPLGPKKANIRG
jgi:hypothetical protein